MGPIVSHLTSLPFSSKDNHVFSYIDLERCQFDHCSWTCLPRSSGSLPAHCGRIQILNLLVVRCSYGYLEWRGEWTRRLDYILSLSPVQISRINFWLLIQFVQSYCVKDFMCMNHQCGITCFGAITWRPG
jgi:hypothetical protein